VRGGSAKLGAVSRRPSRRTILTAAIAAPWAGWALVRGLGLDAGYPLVAMMAFTPYVAALSVVPVVVALVLRAWGVAAVAAVAAVVLAVAVLPRALDGPQVVDAGSGGRTLVVMTSNLYVGSADAGAVMRLAREHDVDVLSVQELTPEIVAALEAAGARARFPHRVLEPHAHETGSGLFARFPLRPIAAGPTERSAQPEGELRLPGGAALRVKAVHPMPPITRASAQAWRRDMQALPGPSAGGTPRLLIGDFNGTLDNRELRRLLDRGYYDAADATGDGLRPTWPVGRRSPPITIDHVLLPAQIKVRRVSIHEIPGSDHRALIAELVLPSAGP
jgi:endonuclease/exonuclease/phosphatase (EEP) superfamily protein YafD